jgi:hypothetical protein
MSKILFFLFFVLPFSRHVQATDTCFIDTQKTEMLFFTLLRARYNKVVKYVKWKKAGKPDKGNNTEQKQKIDLISCKIDVRMRGKEK